MIATTTLSPVDRGRPSPFPPGAPTIASMIAAASLLAGTPARAADAGSIPYIRSADPYVAIPEAKSFANPQRINRVLFEARHGANKVPLSAVSPDVTVVEDGLIAIIEFENDGYAHLTF